MRAVSGFLSPLCLWLCVATAVQANAELDLEVGLEDTNPFEDDPNAMQIDDALTETLFLSATPSARESGYRVSEKHRYQLQLGYADRQLGGLPQNHQRDGQENSYLINRYQLDMKISQSWKQFYKLRLQATASHSRDRLNANHDNADFSFDIREAWFRKQFDNQRLSLGGQIFKLGQIDFFSPVDVLNQQNSQSQRFFEFEDIKTPVMAMKYEWLNENHTWSAYLSPFNPFTIGTVFTQARDYTLAAHAGEEYKDNSPFELNIGGQYQFTWQAANIRLGLFHWFDNNNLMTFTHDPSFSDIKVDQHILHNYQESVSSSNFATVEMDVSLGSFILKADMAFFERKNVYNFQLKETDIEQLTTLSVPYTAVAFSVERMIGNLLLMPVVKFSQLSDVPENTHVMWYENTAADDLLSSRHLSSYQLALIARYRLNAAWSTDLMMFKADVYAQQAVVNVWHWSLSPQRKLEMKLGHFTTETVKMTAKKMNSSFVFMGYVANF